MKNAIFVSLKYWLFVSLLLGGVYPLAVTAIGKIFYSEKVNGSIVYDNKNAIRGSYLIAQKFEDPKYFWSRPSGIDYNAGTSGATNLSLTHKDLRATIITRKNLGAVEDALFSSASGLDPHIGIENAYAQVARVSKARNLDEGTVKSLVEKNIQNRDWHIFGEKTINVMLLNQVLDSRNRE